MDSYSRIALEKFKGKVVRKDLTALMKRGVNAPSYVLEYLLGSYCSTDDQDLINAGIKKITQILSNNYVRNDEIEKIKFTLKEKGEYTIIDKIIGRVDEQNDLYIGQFVNFNIGNFVLPDSYAKQHPMIFSGGIWCMIKLEYNKDDDETNMLNELITRKSKKIKVNTAYTIAGMKPIQIPNISIDYLKEQRKYFSTDEWIMLILRSVGIEGKNLNEKEKFHYLERIVPLFERNYNMVEFGPRGTGKSHIYKEISPYSILISGGSTSISNLFYNLQSKVVGLVGNWDCVAFDEVSGMGFNNPLGLQILKDYMSSGSFTRGKTPVYADASLIFIGNINDTVSNILKVSHLFSPFPKDFNNDSAFFDRMHYYLPGWEIPKVKAEYLTNEYGFISDYFAEFAKEMRKEDYTHSFDQWYKFNNSVNTRDEIAIRKTVSGLIKIIFPDGNFNRDDIEKIIIYAIEGRRRVKEQMFKISGDEFSDVKLGYITDEGKEVIVSVPEKANHKLISPTEQLIGHTFTVAYSQSYETPAIYKLETKRIAGTGKLEIQGVSGIGSKAALESMNAGWKAFIGNIHKFNNVELTYSLYNYLIYINDIQGKKASKEWSVAEFIALCSLHLERPIIPGLIIIGEVTLSGTLSHIKGIEDYIRLAVTTGATQILLPEDAKEEYFKITSLKLDNIKPLFYSNIVDAAKLALDL